MAEQQQEQIILKPQSAGFEAGCLILAFLMLCVSIYVLSLQIGWYLHIEDVEALKAGERPADVRTDPILKEIEKLEETRTAATLAK